MNEILFNLPLDFLLILFPIAWIAYWNRGKSFKEILEELGFKGKPGMETAKQTLIVFFLLVAVSLALSFFSGLLNANDLPKVGAKVAEIAVLSPLYLAYLVTARTLAEEVFFRGFLVKRIGVLGSSAIFAIFHIGYGSVVEVLGAFLLGLVLAAGFKKWNCLYPILFGHMLYNSFALLFIV